MHVKTVRYHFLFPRERQKLETIAIHCKQECGKKTLDTVSVDRNSSLEGNLVATLSILNAHTSSGSLG